MDVVKICEVVDGCEDCPKYGDDCDGDKMAEHTDLISRADAIEAVCKGCHWWSGQCDNDKAFRCDEVCRIEALPSADAVQGEWIRKEREYNDCDGHYAYYWYECSVCGARPPKNQWKNEWHSDYCPSCGATMKGGAE